jgi:hypothetical protein
MKSQEVALKQIKLAVDWVVGDYQDMVKQGLIKKKPTKNQMIEEVYECIMNWTLTDLSISDKPTTYLRLAGKDFIMENIKHEVLTYQN